MEDLSHRCYVQLWSLVLFNWTMERHVSQLGTFERNNSYAFIFFQSLGSMDALSDVDLSFTYKVFFPIALK
jgi:hypothetical protein